MKGKVWLFILGTVIGLVAVAVLALVMLPRIRPYTFHGTVLQSPDTAQDFTLISSNSQRVSLSDFRGELVVLYFGYIFCPDVCPATLAEIAGAMDLLGDKADQVQVIMISVDPERDTPEKMGDYLSHFNIDFLGLIGTPEEIAAVATLYGIFYEKAPGSEATDYLINHTASVMVIDEDGHMKLVFPFGTPAADIAADLDYMLR